MAMPISSLSDLTPLSSLLMKGAQATLKWIRIRDLKILKRDQGKWKIMKEVGSRKLKINLRQEKKSLGGFSWKHQ
jgi:hypothetical protein